MLRLFAHLKDHFLKIRVAFPHESFTTSFVWQNEIEIEYTTDSKYTMAWTSLLPDLEPHKARALVELIGARYPVSTQYKELKKCCPELLFENGTDEWVFFGGSFNPWHSGHQACLNLLPPAKTCFILPDINPHKETHDFELVSAVIELSAKARFSPNQFLVPSFLIDKTKNPTVDWIQRMHKDFPKQKLSLMMGFDSFNTINTWTKASILFPLIHCIYVVSRLETDSMREEAIENVRKLSPGIKIELLGRHGFEEISSTEIRRRL